MSDAGDVLRRAIGRHQYENTLSLAVAQRLQQAQEELLALLVKQDPAGMTPGRQLQRLQSLAKKADEVLARAYGDVDRLTRSNLQAFGQVEIDLTAEGLSKASGIPLKNLRLPTREYLRELLLHDPVQGAVMGDWWKRQRQDARDRFRTELRLGLSRGEGLGELVARVRGTGTVAGTINQRQAEALVRTAVQEIASKVTFRTYEESGIVEEYEYVATLDRRTTLLCRSLDGKVFRLDDAKAPRPPIHWQCRSTTIPRIKGAPPPTREAHADWLRRQPPAVQDEILGPARAQLFREGKVTLDDLVRQDGRVITLRELRGLLPPPPPTPPALPPGPPPAPSNKPLVSAGVRVPATEVWAREVYAAIDAIHTDGVLPPIPLKMRKGIAELAYWEGRIDLQTGKLTPVHIIVREGGPAPDHAIVHETGHFLDAMLGNRGSRYVSSYDPRFKAWRTAVEKTEAWKVIQQKHQAGGPRTDYLEYLLEWEEAWARSYTQWVTGRATGPAGDRLREQLAMFRKLATVDRHGLWDDDDFAPVAEAIDELMRVLGWM